LYQEECFEFFEKRHPLEGRWVCWVKLGYPIEEKTAGKGVGGMREKRKIVLIFLMVMLVMFTVGDISGCTRASEDKKVPKVGPVKLNPHPTSLEGKKVLLRWNGKYNGDRFLSRVGELFTQQVKNVKIIKIWEMDKSTAAISKDAEASEQVAASIVELKPDLVIAAQAD